MRVIVDATAIPADRGGVGRYVDALLPALAAQGVDLVVACQARDAAAMAARLPSATVISVPALIERRPARMAWEQVGLPKLVRSTGAQLVHSPHYTMPWAAGVPVVVTLHDATFFSHPWLHSPVKLRFFRAATRVAVRRAAGIVVPSAATRDEVRRFAGGSTDLFHVAHHGVDRSVFHPVGDVERARVSAALHLDGQRYVGFLGTLEPRKNVPALIRGWVRAMEGIEDPLTLVLAGGRGWDGAVEHALAEVPGSLRVVRAGYMALGDLAGFLSGAEVFTYPSLGEGFGLPVLEAMACGAAVLTTRELSIPEVGGSAVEYCGVDEGSIAEALRRMVGGRARREELGALAIARAADFTWEAAARAHVESFERALRP